MVKFPKFHVRDVDGSSLQERATGRGIPTRPNRRLVQGCHLFGAHITIGDTLEKLAIILANVTMLGPDEPDGICNYRVQHRLELSG